MTGTDILVLYIHTMSTRRKQLLLVLFFSALLATLNWYANAYFLYFTFWWFDIVMHFLGGVFSALTLLWGYHYVLGDYFDQRRQRLFLVALVGTLIIGVLWEVFESIAGIHALEGNIVPDTSLDIVMDLLGALVAFWAFIPQKNLDEVRYTENI